MYFFKGLKDILERAEKIIKKLSKDENFLMRAWHASGYEETMETITKDLGNLAHDAVFILLVSTVNIYML